MHIDQSAPLVGYADVVIDAALDRVWRLQTNVNYWSEWQPDVVAAQLEGKLAVATVFHWRAFGFDITSRIDELHPKWRISWTSDALGLHAIQNFEFEPRADGVKVRTEESISGWLAQIVGFFSPRYLERLLEHSLQTLKDAAELRRR